MSIGALVMKGYSGIPKVPVLLKPHHQMVECYIQDTRWGNVILHFCRDAVGIFCRSSRLVLHSLMSYIQDTSWGNFIPLQRCSRYNLQSQPTGLRWFTVVSRILVGRILSLSRDAVGIIVQSQLTVLRCHLQDTLWRNLILQLLLDLFADLPLFITRVALIILQIFCVYIMYCHTLIFVLICNKRVRTPAMP